MNATPGKAREVFLAAVKMSPEAWPAYLAEACGGDEELRRRVANLLHAHQDAGSFLAPDAPLPAATVDEHVCERAGTVVGPYKLMEQIGEGGMGLVFVAEQQHPVRRKVAFKVIKPGMDTRQVVARFEAERQALALMDHPNIAKVHDGGETDSGRPYFVMELVKGVPITEFCDQNQVPVRQRLELFLSVTQAVQHAHQKGIIHRDIKPSNVLVMSQDGTPVVKVIDFGIAKAIGQQLTDKTIYTQFAQMVGTPLYMSPEQAGQSSLDVDTRSDIYSLGVLLYELLTGTTPFTKERLRQVDHDEMRRIIREEEPPRPSTRLRRDEGGGMRDETKRTRRTRWDWLVPFSSLIPHPSSFQELDWIVMKALEKDRNRRYESASAFAADVQRYLADEPVLACAPSAGYRVRKYVRRHRVGLTVAGLILFSIALLAGGVGWVIRDRTARESRLEQALERAELFQESGKREDALGAYHQAVLLSSEVRPDPTRNARLSDLKERLDAEVRDQEFMARYEDIRLRVQGGVSLEESRFTHEAAFPEIQEALRRYGIAIGEMAPDQAAARVRLGPEPVRRSLIAALDECMLWAPAEKPKLRSWLLVALAAADNDAWRARARRVRTRRDWKVLEQMAGEVDVRKQPPSFLIRVVTANLALGSTAELGLLRRIQRAYPADLWANHGLAEALAKNGQQAEAIRYYTAALALRPDSPGIYLNRGGALADVGELDAAIADYRQCVALAPQYAAAHTNLGIALRRKGRLDEAIAEHREAIRLKKAYAIAHTNLGNALCDKGQLDEAIAEHREAIRLRPEIPEAHYSLGSALYAKGQVDEAIAAFREAIRIRKGYANAYTNLGMALNLKGQLDEAIAAYREAIRLDDRRPEPHYNLGNALSAKGRLDEAIAAYREAIRIKRDDAAVHFNLGLALHAKYRLDEAIAAFREASRIKKDYAEAHFNLGMSLVAHGEIRAALEPLRRGHELGSRRPGWPHPSARWLRQCERLAELERRLPALLEGKATPAGPDERIELAEVCALKRLNRAAVRFHEEAFAAKPGLADDLNSGRRYKAARVAALAGCGQGKDADKLEDEERARLRGQALEWLRADLEAWRRLHDSKAEKAPSAARVAQVLQNWLVDPSFAGVRGSEALARLPEAERQPWHMLWHDVADTLKRAK
jgi:serine/threonine-protein kinase